MLELEAIICALGGGVGYCTSQDHMRHSLAGHQLNNAK